MESDPPYIKFPLARTYPRTPGAMLPVGVMQSSNFEPGARGKISFGRGNYSIFVSAVFEGGLQKTHPY